MDIIITDKTANQTIRRYLREELGYSSAMLKRLKFTEGGILVNGSFRTVRYELTEGDVLSLAVEDTPADVSPYIYPVELPLSVLYEDDAITVVDKGANMPSHPSLGHQNDTVANALAYRYRDRAYVFRPVNRLDRDTTGVMLTANTKLASYQMYRRLRDGAVHKQYIAVTHGVPPAGEGVIERSLRRRGESIIEREACEPDAPGARYARTEYTVLAENGEYSVLLCRPITGRTHQIRVHLASVGCPLCGDTLYGGETAHIARHALHAVTSDFTHPITDAPMHMHAPLPADMRALILAVFPDGDAIIRQAEDI